MGCLWKWGGFRTSIAIYIMGTMLINHGILGTLFFQTHPCMHWIYLTCTSNWAGLGIQLLLLDPASTVFRTKVGVWDWEEHVYIFTAVATPNLASTAGVSTAGVWNEGQIALREISKKSGVISYPLDFYRSMENGIVWWCSCWWEGVTATIQRRYCDSDSYLHARTRGFTVSSMLKNAGPSKEGFSCFSFWKAFHFRHHFFTSRKHPTTAPLPRCCRSLWPRCMQPWHLWPGINHPKLLQLLNHQDAPGLFCLVKKSKLLYNSL